MARRTRDATDQRSDYINAMLDSFEHDNPGIAEVLAVHDSVMRHYIEAAGAHHELVVRTSSTQSIVEPKPVK